MIILDKDENYLASFFGGVKTRQNCLCGMIRIYTYILTVYYCHFYILQCFKTFTLYIYIYKCLLLLPWNWPTAPLRRLKNDQLPNFPISPVRMYLSQLCSSSPSSPIHVLIFFMFCILIVQYAYEVKLINFFNHIIFIFDYTVLE